MVFRRVIAGGKIGDRDARFFHAEACTGANPVLGEQGVARTQDDGE